jgi:EmrB/QacA subfamily drug resistance transporter
MTRRAPWWQRERARPDAVREHPHDHWLAVATVCLGAFMGQLDASIVTVALPTLQRDLHGSLASVEWVVLSYVLTLVALVTVAGRLADAVGRKLLYLHGFALFTLASAACAAAPSLLALDLLRVLQGVGAALLQANSVALIATSVPRRLLGRALGIQGTAQAVGLAAGPTVGGLLVAAGGWRWIFLVNVPVGVIGVVSGVLLLPRSRHLAARTPVDLVGVLLLVPAVSAVLLSLSLATHRPDPTTVLALAVAAVVLGTGFAVRQRRAAHPLIDPELFRLPGLSLGLAGGLLGYLALFGLLFVTPFYLELARHLTPSRAGLELTVLPIAMALTAPVAGRVADRQGPRTAAVGGLATAAVALLAAAAVPHPPVVLLLAAAGVGLGSFLPANSTSVVTGTPTHRSGQVSGLLNLTRGLGTALGIAVTGLVFGSVSGNPAGAYRASLLALGTAALVGTLLAVRRPAGRAG